MSGVEGFVTFTGDSWISCAACGTRLDTDTAIRLHRCETAPLLARIKELEADANRYRWLRSESARHYEGPIVAMQVRTDYGLRYTGPLIGTDLDAALDAARVGGA